VTRSGRYTAEQLAYRAGIPLRTVRYYVQEKLIDPPLGRGRGSHFDDRHMAQLEEVRALQMAGFDLQSIRQRTDELREILARVGGYEPTMQLWGAALRAQSAPAKRPAREREEPELDPASSIRIPMADGIELMVSKQRRLPSPKDFVEIALFIRKVFGDR
jgi:DNA-binding transcriptional MerR regulator